MGVFSEVILRQPHEGEINMIQDKLELRGICKSFGGIKALEDISFELHSGMVYGLAGENGAGKSTTMKIINGAYVADAGEILVDGVPVKVTSPQDAQRIGVGMVYQELSLLPDLNVAENIFISHLSQRKSGYINWKNIHEKARELLHMMEIDIDTHIRLGDLKVAQQQLIAIVRALSRECKVIILDEPTSSLTDKDSTLVLNAVRRLKALGYIVIYISHKLREVLEITDEVIVFRNGHKIGNYQSSQLNEESLAELIAGRKLESKYPKVRFEKGEELLRAEHLSVPGMLEDVSFVLHKGEVLGIAGLMGAGKTEVAKTLFGVFGSGNPRATGEIYLNGKRITARIPKDAIGKKIGLVPENRAVEGLLTEMSISDNVILASMDKISKFGWMNQKKIESLLDSMKKSLQIKCGDVNNPVSSLSGGNQQKIVLAKWLAAESEIIIFDEPTRGIDVGAKVAVYELMNELVRQGVGVIIMSSEADEVFHMSDTMLLLKNGRTAMTCSTSEFDVEEMQLYM